MPQCNRITTADAAAIMATLTMAAKVMGDVEPDNDFFPGETVSLEDLGGTIDGELEDRGCGYGYGYGYGFFRFGQESAGASKGGAAARGGFGYGVSCEPDTVLEVTTSSGTFSDDDGSIFFSPEGGASGLQNLSFAPGELVTFQVSGFDDFDFDGFSDADPLLPHGQQGSFEVVVDYRDASGNFISSEFPVFDTFFNGDETFSGSFTPPAGAVTFDINIDTNFFDDFCQCVADVDFYTICDLTPGADYDVEVTFGEFDSVLGQFDGQGGFIQDDDDGGFDLLSRFTATADASGKMQIVISGFPDFNFEGQHTEFGFYTIELTRLGGCNSADLFLPFGVLNSDDVIEFVNQFNTANLAVADIFPQPGGDGLLNSDDVIQFVNEFNMGCPTP